MWLVLGFLVLSAADDSEDCDDRNFHSLETESSARLECGAAFRNKCICSRICYEGRHQYVVNCTNSGFTDVEPLENLPNKTQVIFNEFLSRIL